MYSVSAQFLEAVRNPPAIVVRVEVWRGGLRVDTYGDDGLPIFAGEVQVDGTKATQRTLSGLQVEATDATWSLLSPPGTRLHCYRGFRYGPGQSELVPLGKFAIPSLTETYGGDWSGQIASAPDLMSIVDRQRLTAPRAFPAGTPVRDEAATLLAEVLGPVTNTARSMAKLPSTAVVESDRLGEITDAVAAIGGIVYVDPDGTPIIADAPTIADTAVWDITSDPTSSILYTADRTRSDELTWTAVLAVSSQLGGTAPFPPQLAVDSNPDSPTYYKGALGLVPFRLESDKWETAAEALAAAQAKLPQVTATRAEFDLTAECNPALAAWDTVAVHLPPRGFGGREVVERHMAAGFTVPLTVDGVQRITTRSAVADLTSE